MEDLHERVTVVETKLKAMQDFSSRCLQTRQQIEREIIKEAKVMRQDFDRIVGGILVLKWGVGFIIALNMVIAAYLALKK